MLLDKYFLWWEIIESEKMATQRFSRPIREGEKYFSCLLSPFPLKMIYWEFCVVVVLLALFSFWIRLWEDSHRILGAPFLWRREWIGGKTLDCDSLLKMEIYENVTIKIL